MSVYFLSLCWVHLICSVVLIVIAHIGSSLYDWNIDLLFESKRFLYKNTDKQYKFWILRKIRRVQDLQRKSFTLKETAAGSKQCQMACASLNRHLFRCNSINTVCEMKTLLSAGGSQASYNSRVNSRTECMWDTVYKGEPEDSSEDPTREMVSLRPQAI